MVKDELSLQAPAKVNLCLAVEYPPQDGYHLLSSIFQTLDLHDTLVFAPEAAGVNERSDAGADAGKGAGANKGTDAGEGTDGSATASTAWATTRMGTRVSIRCAGLSLAAEDNLVFKAIDAVEQEAGRRFWDHPELHVAIDKRIPAGGGLGGGSSNAAAALKAFASANGMDACDDCCLAAARSIGADVAFFLYGGAAYMKGRGDVLVRRLPDFPLPLVLMGASEGNSTASVYAAFDAEPQGVPDAEALALALEEHASGACAELLALAHLCANNLEPAACAAQPVLEQRLQLARRSSNVLHALVTGSGSTSYAICADGQKAHAFAQEIAPYCAWVHVALPTGGPVESSRHDVACRKMRP